MNADGSVPAAPKGSLVPFSLEQLRASSVNFAEAARSANTRRAYAADWRDFVGWCDGHAITAAPADGATVALYLTAHAEAVSVATLARRLAAIRAAHEALALSPPVGRELSYVWRGIRRTMGRPPRAKRALTTDDLRALLVALPDNAIGVRDRALLLVGFAAALRRSELSAIHIEGETDAPIRLRIVSAGLQICLDRSKADQEGRGANLAVPRGLSTNTCPVAALEAWLVLAGIDKGPVFRRVSAKGRVGAAALSPQMIAHIVKRAATRAGFDPDCISAHSLRAGLATSAAAGDAPPDLIMRQMRHARFDTTRRYIRDADIFMRNAVSFTGL